MTQRRQTNQQPHIGIFNDSFPPIIDGVTLTVENYVRYLAEMNLNPCVVTPWNPMKVDCGCDVLRYFSLPIPSRRPYRYGYPKIDPFIWRRLAATPFRLAHSHCPFSSGRLAVYVKKRQRIPLIGTFHSKYKSDLQHSFRSTPWCVPIIMKRILDFFNACDEVWIPQAAVEETVREYGYQGPLTVVDNGIDFTGMDSKEVARAKKAARSEMGIADDEISLLFVGQHIWEKGIRVIADALKLIDGKTPFRMNFVGTGYAQGELARLIESYGIADRVKINGVVSDRERIKKFYAAADLFLFPSLYDNAPLVVREAAALGTPSVIPSGSTASEVITDEVNGFLTSRDAAAYASLISLLAADRDRIRRVGAGARRTLGRSWSDVVEEVADRYRVILKNFKP